MANEDLAGLTRSELGNELNFLKGKLDVLRENERYLSTALERSRKKLRLNGIVTGGSASTTFFGFLAGFASPVFVAAGMLAAGFCYLSGRVWFDDSADLTDLGNRYDDIVRDVERITIRIDAITSRL